MIRNGHDLEPGEQLNADVCIVGAGAAGITLALELSRQAPDLSVLLLDGGTQPGYNPDPPPREVSPGQFLYEGEMEGDMNTIRPRFLTQTRSRSYGGSTNCWGGWCRPLDAVDFRGHRGYRGWPITREELIPFYERAQGFCSLDRFEYDDPQYWVDRAARSGRRLGTIPDLPDDSVRTVCFQGIRDTRWSFFQDYHDELDAAPNVRVVVNASLIAIEAAGVRPGDPVDRVNRLRLRALDPDTGKPGVEFSATAGRFVLAMGGIETVRAMLLSPTANQPGGIGNNADLLGRFFNVHPVVSDAALVRFGRGTGWPAAVNAFYSSETRFYEEGQGAPRAEHHQEVQPYEGHAVNEKRFAGPQADPAAYTRVWATLTPTADALDRTGAGNFRLILRGGSTSTKVDVNWEQVSDPENRVVLGDRVDAFGLRVVDLRWRINPADQQTYAIALSLCEAKLRRAGYLDEGGSFQPLFDISDRGSWHENLPNPGDHHMGGTRMDDDPGQGVVDSDARVHGTHNLYVSSCSVWPSGGWANPTLTIVAMASRLASHLLAGTGAGHTLRIDEATLPDRAPAAEEAA
jgi:choline dehydrogenase-like flavoprotein